MTESEYLEDVYSEDDYKQYIKLVNKIPILKEKEKVKLILKYQKEKDIEARNRVIESDLRWVIKQASKKKYQNQGLTLNELIQEGSIGLFTAINKYDPKFKKTFLTYANPWINQAIQRAIDNKCASIRIPTYRYEEERKYKKKIESLKQKLKREPTKEEIEKNLGIPFSKIEEMNLFQDIYSIDDKIDKNNKDGINLIDTIGKEDTNIFFGIEMEALHTNLFEIMNKCLDDREKLVLIERFGNSKTEEEVGKILGVTKERVRQIQEKALVKMRHPRNTSKIKNFYRE